MTGAENIILSNEVLQLITPEQAWFYRIIPKGKNNGTLELYADDAFDEEKKTNSKSCSIPTLKQKKSIPIH